VEARDLFEPFELPREMAVFLTIAEPVRVDELHLRSAASGVVPATVVWQPVGGAAVTSTYALHPGQTWDLDAIIGRALGLGDTLSAAATASRVTLTGRGTVGS
jgi:hypothetical protein